jgi:hypothetical protein
MLTSTADPTAAAAAAHQLDSQQQQQRQHSYLNSSQSPASQQAPVGGDDPDFLYPVAEPLPAPSPDELAQCWRQLSSLEAAAAAGCWQPSAATAAAAAAAAAVPAASLSFSGGVSSSWTGTEHWQQHYSSSSGAVSSSSSQVELLPAFAADLAAVGHIALQLYQQQHHQQDVALGRAAGIMTAQALSSSSSSSSSSRLWPQSQQQHVFQPSLQGVPAAVALFVQQCAAGQLSATGLVHSSFFPIWMDEARKFMLKLLLTQQLHRELEPRSHSQQICVRDPAAASTDGNGSTAGTASTDAAAATTDDSCGGVVSWQLCNAFESLARLAGPGGELQQLGQTPEALQLCLPAVLYVIRSKLLGQQQQQGTGAVYSALHRSAFYAKDTQQQSQQVTEHEEYLTGIDENHQQQQDFVDAVCVVILRLASVLSAQQLQQHLLPLLQELLTAGSEESDRLTAPTPTASFRLSDSAAATAAGVPYAVGGAVSDTALRIAASRRAVLQPLLWQILLTKLPQQQLLSVLLPPLLTAALEAQSHWLGEAAAAAPELQLPGLSHGSVTSSSSSSAVNSVTAAAGFLALMPAAVPATKAAGTQPAATATADAHDDTQQQQQQQQQFASSQGQLAASCLAVLAQALPFPVVSQYLLRPLLIALPWAGSSGSSSTTSSVAAPYTCGHQHLNGAAQALLAVGSVLPQRLAAEFVFIPVLQLALLPLQSSNSSSSSSYATAGSPRASSSSSSRRSSATAAAAAAAAGDDDAQVSLHTVAALPVLEGLLAHVLPVLKPDTVLPAVAEVTSPNAAAAAAAGVMGASSTSAAAASTVQGLNSSGASSSSRASTPPVPASSSSSTSSAAATRAGQQNTAGVQLHQLSQLLLQPPDVNAAQHSPLLYPRIAGLLLLALEQASSTAPTSSSSSGSYTTLVCSWLLPQVLLPLLAPAAAEAWQQHGQAVARCYWRVVLLLYAAVVRQLGLREVREAVPGWHGVEVSFEKAAATLMLTLQILTLTACCWYSMHLCDCCWYLFIRTPSSVVLFRVVYHSNP